MSDVTDKVRAAFPEAQFQPPPPSQHPQGRQDYLKRALICGLALVAAYACGHIAFVLEGYFLWLLLVAYLILLVATFYVLPRASDGFMSFPGVAEGPVGNVFGAVMLVAPPFVVFGALIWNLVQAIGSE